MSSEIVLVFNVIAITSLLLSGVFILALRGPKRPAIFFSACRIMTSVFLIMNVIQAYHTPYYAQVLWNPIHLLASLIAYPLLFAYMFSLMRPESIRRAYWLVCYSPLALLAGLHVLFTCLHGRLPVITDYEQLHALLGEPGLWVRFVATGLFALEVIIFAVLTLRMQREHERNLQSDFSYTEGATLEWVRWIIAITVIKGIFAVLLMMMEGRAIKVVTGILFIVEPVITTVWVLRQKELYRQPSTEERQQCDDEPLAVTVPPMKREQLKEQLLHLLEHEEIFMDTDLSSDKVREMLCTNRTYLSQVINQELGTTFYNLINTYRLRKAVELMQDPRHSHISLKSIATICGFKSLSAFSAFFKQTYGKCPSEWGDRQTNSLSKSEKVCQ